VAIEEQRITSFSESRSQFGPSNGSSDAARTTRSAYTQLLGDPLENVSFSSGLRVDDSDRFGTFVTYRIGAALRLATGTRFRATVATGFKEPTFFENFATGFAVGNPDLDPERSASFEAGVEQSLWSGVARVDVAAFHQTFKDLVQFTFAPPNPGDPNYFNVAEARSRGIEMGLNIRPSTSFRAVLDLSYTDTEVIDAGFDAGDPDAAFAQGERLLRRPEFAGALAFEYTVGVVTVGERTSFVGDRIDRDFSTFPARRVTLDAYQLLDVYARVALTKPLPGSVLLRLDNALDKDYEQVLGFPARGRTLTVGVETRF
ncbi:MAG: TonB-dependent receptor domain-containing protein, partial [Gemmatimonadales bacterium]